MKIATKIWIFESGCIKPPFIMARVTNTPTTGKKIILAAQTDRRAKTGRPDLGLSLTSIRANDTPSKNNVKGTLIAPINLAFIAK